MADWRKVERSVRDTLGEGVLWSARQQAVFWVDILAPALNRLSLADGSVARWDMPEPLGWVSETQDGTLIGGVQSGFCAITLDPFRVTPLLDHEPHLPGNRANDGKADRYGAIWCGTMDMAEEEARGSLYRIAPDGAVSVVDGGYMVPNGPAFSPCGKWLYHSDTALRTVYRYALSEHGAHDRQPFICFVEDDGYPDGMTVDADGFLWIAHWDGGRVSRFSPEGALDRAIALPARRITNIAFAGENLDRMFVTSAALGLPPSEYDGALFEVACAVRGTPTYLAAAHPHQIRFAG
jgi:xylono-1,5-lactonase